MKKMIYVAGLAYSFVSCSFSTVLAQAADSIKPAKDSSYQINKEQFKQLTRTESLECTLTGVLVPAAMVGYGFYALNNPTLRDVNHHTKGWFKEIPNNTDFRPRTKIDNYLQVAPVAAVYILNMAGVKGKHNLRDRSILLGMSALLTSGAVVGIKNWTNEQRPNQQDWLSFPSGHTATAFAAAEFMWQEYKDVSPWIGMTGYIAAATTGALRMYNNKHWLSDVVAGAGLGILSTKAAYWAYPWIQRKLFKSGNSSGASKIIMPSYNPQFKSVGLTLTLFPGN
ncbi:PAP2 superfamily protein [Chitinophaga terrae (ex Kim and Jung 2007)]|uniref:PAP2 superfamily protein n=1 Tax=Chitinophaga terrae (ex Kim and Jung 2007) TaxID=408074 RepID=A0A1H4B734_9BACT|nr:phosphatase PAP2 family protein [Chitinophaga terrae (ex Kim and Jung 2007)]MDQ0106331.1 hypothetical protein [Chitinophaga terrae (ex Kim and Jung 2007)]GEP91203.1 hypothetical protein CTE07_28480 [Chitinophaga terrae (ex Kim and Jung 2007)]SEA43951.1 PAP2 superfamily protein [Chitinophaga terrae (ex Kim and Jung 2007)]